MLKVTVQGKTHIKKTVLVFGPLRFYPPYTNGLVVNAIVVRPLKNTFFLCVSSPSGGEILTKKCCFPIFTLCEVTGDHDYNFEDWLDIILVLSNF